MLRPAAKRGDATGRRRGGGSYAVRDGRARSVRGRQPARAPPAARRRAAATRGCHGLPRRAGARRPDGVDLVLPCPRALLLGDDADDGRRALRAAAAPPRGPRSARMAPPATDSPKSVIRGDARRFHRCPTRASRHRAARFRPPPRPRAMGQDASMIAAVATATEACGLAIATRSCADRWRGFSAIASPVPGARLRRPAAAVTESAEPTRANRAPREPGTSVGGAITPRPRTGT